MVRQLLQQLSEAQSDLLNTALSANKICKFPQRHKSRTHFDYILLGLGIRSLIGFDYLKQNLPGSGKNNLLWLQITVVLVQLSFIICYANGFLENVVKVERADSMEAAELIQHESGMHYTIYLTKWGHCLLHHLNLTITVEKLILLEGSSSSYKEEVQTRPGEWYTNIHFFTLA